MYMYDFSQFVNFFDFINKTTDKVAIINTYDKCYICYLL